MAAQNGSNQGSVRFCVALNPSIRASSDTYLKRILGYNGGGIPLNNNYARNDMELYENTTQITPSETTDSGRDGQNVSAGTGSGQYNTQAFWTSIDAGWNFTSVWEWGSNNLPTLRNMPTP